MPERLGRYTLEKKLATGGMAEVFLARQTGPKGFAKLCVVKRMLAHLAEDEGFVRMFLDEARLAAQLNHPNIAQIFDFGAEGGTYFLAMEYVPGSNLRTLVKEHARHGVKLPCHLAAKIIAQAALALDYAHRAVDVEGRPLELIHRDVSPQNILLATSGVVKLIDFGVAKASTSTQRTQTGIIKGKYAYMSPEQIRGQPLDPRSDVFGLGLVLYELLAGQRAIQGETEQALAQAALKMRFIPIEQLRPDIPARLKAVIDRALQRERSERYPSAAQMGAELEGFLADARIAVSGADLARLLRSPRQIEVDSSPSMQPLALGALPAGDRPTKLAPSSAASRGDVSELSTQRVPPPEPIPTLLEPRPSVPRREDPPRTEVLAARPPRAWAVAWFLAGGLVLGLAVGALYLLPRAPEPREAPPAVAVIEPPQRSPTTTPPPPEPAPTPTVELPSPARVPAKRAPAPAPAPATGALTISSVPAMEVWIDGKPRGRTPVQATVPAGEHAIAFREDGLGLRHERVVQLRPGEERREEWRPGKGKVIFRAVPYAEVFLGEKSLGLTPMEPLELWEGKYAFRFSNPETERTESREVSVLPGQELVLKIDLREPSEPPGPVEGAP